MTKPLAKWIQKRYSLLWNRFKSREFTFEQARKILKTSAGINVFFSDLRKSGWLEVRLDSKDNRKRVYKLLSPEEGFKKLK